MRSKRSARVLWIIAILIVALLAVWVMVHYTRTGAGVRGDSVRYVMLARNMLAGKGYSRVSGGGEIYPETGFAPFLPVVLAGFGAIGADLFAAGRYLNVMLYGLNILLVGALLLRATDSGITAIVGSGLFILAETVFEWHAWLMSEPLFIFLSLVSIYSIVEFVLDNRISWLYLAAFTAAAAGLTRYVGISLAAAGGLMILLFSQGSFRRRMTKAVLFGLLAVLPFALWFVRNQNLGVEGLANRKILFHPIRPEVLRVYLFEFASWFVPEQFALHRLIRAGLAILLAVFAPAVYLFSLIRSGSRFRKEGMLFLDALVLSLLFLIPFYILILAINSFLLDAATTFSGVIRYTTPLYVFTLLLEITCFAFAAKELNFSKAIAGFGVAYSVVLMIFFGMQTLPMAGSSSLDLGYTGIRYLWPDIVQVLEEHDESIPIISNNPEMVYYLVDRPAYMKPIRYDPYQQAFREDFEEQIDLARSRLESGSIFVFFDEPSSEERDILALLNMSVIYGTERVKIYAYPDAR